ncbi:MAG TPA: methyltransferase domain-containing protein [Ktedonobacterales bacterium]|nr:methyltransferase domain-containing protein [Ktedonobacterales bacterium]
MPPTEDTSTPEAERPALDLEAVEKQSKLVYRNVVGGMVTLLAVIGDRLDLFKTLAAEGPLAADEFAEHAHIHPRYAEEWLGGMASAGYITYDAATARFLLTPTQAAVIADEGGPYFLGGPIEMAAALGGVLDLVVQTFREGGGVPQSAYDPRLFEGMERGGAGWTDHVLVESVLPLLPEVEVALRRGAHVADIGCGGGRLLIRLARAFPASRFAGYDLFAPNVERATANASAAGLADRVSFHALDASAGLPGTFDVIFTSDVVHDAAQPVTLLRAIRAALTPEGVYVCIEPATEETLEQRAGLRGAFLYGASILYCMTTSLAQGGVGLGAHGLPESRMRALCHEAGFSRVRHVPTPDAFGKVDTVESVFEIRP